jgi:hypothetical protein
MRCIHAMHRMICTEQYDKNKMIHPAMKSIEEKA